MKNIILTKQGLWKFYHDENLGICFYGPKSDTPMILFDKGTKDFDATCDSDGNIYLLCQDNSNNIYLFFYDRTSWRKQCILESKSKVPYDKNFSIIVINGWVNAFYTIRHSEKVLLIHHILNNNTQPKVIESCDEPIIYSITTDINNNIYCVYLKECIGFQAYKWNEKRWQPFSPVQRIQGEICSLSAICDINSALHIVCSVRTKNEYSSYYISRNGTEKITDGFLRNTEPCIICYDKYYVLFKANGRLMQCVTENPELGFMKPSFYFPGSFCTNSLFRFSCQYDLKHKKIFTEKIYGTEPRLNSFEAAIIQDEIDKIDFSLPSVPTEITPEIESYIQIAKEAP